MAISKIYQSALGAFFYFFFFSFQLMMFKMRLAGAFKVRVKCLNFYLFQVKINTGVQKKRY